MYVGACTHRCSQERETVGIVLYDNFLKIGDPNTDPKGHPPPVMGYYGTQ